MVQYIHPKLVTCLPLHPSAYSDTCRAPRSLTALWSQTSYLSLPDLTAHKPNGSQLTLIRKKSKGKRRNITQLSNDPISQLHFHSLRYIYVLLSVIWRETYLHTCFFNPFGPRHARIRWPGPATRGWRLDT